MANIKISQMSQATSLEGTELIPIVQNGNNKITTPNKIAFYDLNLLGKTYINGKHNTTLMGSDLLNKKIIATLTNSTLDVRLIGVIGAHNNTEAFHNEIIYKCTRNSDIPLSHDLSALVGTYVELV